MLWITVVGAGHGGNPGVNTMWGAPAPARSRCGRDRGVHTVRTAFGGFPPVAGRPSTVIHSCSVEKRCGSVPFAPLDPASPVDGESLRFHRLVHSSGQVGRGRHSGRSSGERHEAITLCTQVWTVLWTGVHADPRGGTSPSAPSRRRGSAGRADDEVPGGHEQAREQALGVGDGPELVEDLTRDCAEEQGPGGDALADHAW